MMDNLGKKILSVLAALLAKDVWSKLASKATSSVLDKYERKIGWKRSVRVGNGFTLFISNKDMNYIIKIIE